MKNQLIITLNILVLVFLFSCGNKKINEEIQNNQQQAIENILPQEPKPDNYRLMQAVLFHQKAAEYKALCYQAFNMAKLALDKDLMNTSIDKKRCVILDIDETTLDNSPFEATCILDSISYPDGWNEWCNLSSAKPIPGVLDFLDYVKSNAVDIYYVTNRKEELREPTKQNLLAFGFPNVDDKHLLMRTTTSSKEARRNSIKENHHISLLVGDNLSDFEKAFEELTTEKRNKLVEDKSNYFGKRFIILPNAMYGDWEGALLEYNYKLSNPEKLEMFASQLEGFETRQQAVK